MRGFVQAIIVVCAVAGGVSDASNKAHARAPETPGAAARSSASNFKDMVFAVCIARSHEGQAAADAAGSARALMEWTQYDAEKGPDEIERIVNRFLGKNYQTPLGEPEGSASQFNLLKCIDLYHSRDLKALGKQLVLPERQRRNSR